MEKQKKQYVAPLLEASEMEVMHVLAASGGTGGTGEDIPWGASGMRPFGETKM